MIVGLIGLVGSGQAIAADNTWTNAAGNMLWDTTSANWTFPTIWNNANIDSAFFGPTGVGTITVQSPIVVRAIRFDTAGYTLNGSGANTFTLSAGGGGSLGVGEIQTNANATIGAVIAGTVGMTKTGVGTLTLRGTNTYTGGTTISAGTLDIGGGGTTGSITGDITNNGVLHFNRSDTSNFAGTTSGTGSVVVTTTGVNQLNLNGTFGHTGGTTITSGSEIEVNTTTGVLNGNVTNNGALSFNGSAPATFGGIVSGTGSLTTFPGVGTLTLTGNNTYTGSTSVLGGTLQLGTGGTTGSIAGGGTVFNSGTVAFNRSDSVSFSSVINGNGAVAKLAANTLTLTGANTYTGITTISAGTLEIGNGDTTGSIAGNVTNNAALIFNRSNASSYGGAISGSGTVTKLGAGPLSFTGANTHTGGTTISAGTLDIGGGGTTGSIAGSITNNAALHFNRSDTSTFSGTTSGTGSVIVTTTGVNQLNLNGTFGHTGGTTINAGSEIEVNTNTGVLTGNVTDNGALSFNGATPATFGGIVSGSGSLTTFPGVGTLTLTGDNTYTGSTSVLGGTLQLGNGGTTGSIAGGGTVFNNGTVAFNRSDSTSFGSIINGNGAVTKLGAATLTLTRNNTYTGITTISAGTLQIGNGSVNGSIVGNVTNNSALQFNRSDSVIFDPVISGTGTVTKLGAGTLTLTGVNTYSGNTIISAGNLALTGTASFASSNTVRVDASATLTVSGLTGGLNFDGTRFAIASGRTLTGFGSVIGGVTARNNTDITPGSGVGTLTVNGVVEFQPGSNLNLNLNGLLNIDTDRGRLVVNGDLSFSGTAATPFDVRVIRGGSFVGTSTASYTIADATSISSVGLDTPILLTVGPGGTASVTNSDNIRLFVNGFVPGEQFSLFRNANVLTLTFTPVPEPATILGISLAVTGACCWWRRRGHAGHAS